MVWVRGVLESSVHRRTDEVALAHETPTLQHTPSSRAQA